MSYSTYCGSMTVQGAPIPESLIREMEKKMEEGSKNVLSIERYGTQWQIHAYSGAWSHEQISATLRALHAIAQAHGCFLDGEILMKGQHDRLCDLRYVEASADGVETGYTVAQREALKERVKELELSHAALRGENNALKSQFDQLQARLKAYNLC